MSLGKPKTQTYNGNADTQNTGTTKYLCAAILKNERTLETRLLHCRSVLIPAERFVLLNVTYFVIVLWVSSSVCDFGNSHLDEFVRSVFISILPSDRWVHLAGNLLWLPFCFWPNDFETGWLFAVNSHRWLVLLRRWIFGLVIDRLVRRWMFGLVIGLVIH